MPPAKPHPQRISPRRRKPSWTGKKNAKRPQGYAFTLRLYSQREIAAFDAIVSASGAPNRNAWFRSILRAEDPDSFPLRGEQEG